MSKKLVPYTLKPMVSKKLSNRIERVNSAYDKICKDWVSLGNELILLDEEMKKDNYSSIPSVEKELRFSWTHAKRLIEVFRFSKGLTKKELKRYPIHSVGSMSVISRMNKSHLKKALKEYVSIKDEDGIARKVPLIRPDTTRKEIEDFRFEQNQKSVKNKKKKIDEVHQTLTITFDKDISSRRLNDKLNELDCITDKDFKVEVDIGRFSKYLKQPTPKRVKKK